MLPFVAFLVASLVLSCARTFAQSDDIDRQRCRAFVSDVSVAACSAVIARGTASTLTLAEVYRYRAQAYLHAGDPDRALADAEAASRLNPQENSPLLIHGLALYAKGDTRAALADFNAAIARDDRFAEAIYARGLVERALGERAQAQADFAAAIDIRGNAPSTIADFGITP
jgi:tetratricopeptide (TPR) repeat protein